MQLHHHAAHGQRLGMPQVRRCSRVVTRPQHGLGPKQHSSKVRCTKPGSDSQKQQPSHLLSAIPQQPAKAAAALQQQQQQQPPPSSAAAQGQNIYVDFKDLDIEMLKLKKHLMATLASKEDVKSLKAIVLLNSFVLATLVLLLVALRL